MALVTNRAKPQEHCSYLHNQASVLQSAPRNGWPERRAVCWWIYKVEVEVAGG